MTILPILIAPSRLLKTRCEPFEHIDDALHRLLDDMLDTMHDAPGIGLAAPQIGITRRAVVVDLGQDEDGAACSAPLCMINPELLWQSDDESVHEEGCLSVPDFYAEIARPASCRVSYLDKLGARQELLADGLLATCIQHELDHLDGILFLDYLSALKRNMILRKLNRGKSAKAPEL